MSKKFDQVFIITQQRNSEIKALFQVTLVENREAGEKPVTASDAT